MALYELPANLKKHSLCPGCGHGIILRLIAETIEELGLQDKKILVLGVGCSCNANGILGGDDFQCAHGRASAVATGMKLYLESQGKDVCIITYQGDGDAGVIGLAETLNAAYRNENITVFTINNSNFAMTGEITLRGQVLPVGGIKEKILAAKRAKITDIILSEKNENDINEINDKYLEGLTFHYVKNMSEVIPLVFEQ